MEGRYMTKDNAMRILRNEDGIALVAALLVMIVLAFLGAAIIFTSSTDLKIARNTTRTTQALMVSESGLADAINYLRADPKWGPDLNKNGSTSDDAAAWAAQSAGTVQLANQTGTYSVVVYDEAGNYGRLNNSARSDKYTTLGTNDVLLEATGTVSGVTRKIGLVVRSSITAFDYATFSDSVVDGTGSGSNPGKFVGKLYAKDDLKLQGNYDVSQAQAESPTKVTPNCNSGKFQSCNDSAAAVTAPVLDFPYYQDQANFPTQQVFKMTPTVGSTTSCGGNCKDWPVNFEMTTLGTTYTITAMMHAVKSGSDWNHTVSWCADPSWNGTGNCPGGSAPNTYAFTAGKAESSKPFINADQFNAYTAATGAYTSSVVNVFDATKHLEFLGPGAGQTSTITASILVGTSTSNTEPVGKIDIEGGAGTLNFQPANGVAIVAEKVEFKAKYSSINVNVGTATNGAAIIATDEFEVEASSGNTNNFTLNGSVVVGNGSSTGELDIGGNGVVANFTYTSINNLPEGWQNYGTMSLARREWREL
ncbi:MAG: hypothetical protein ACE5GY_07215 [Thermodesulfobacteriota bacterium]